MTDMTPPPLKFYRVVIDSPELPEKYEYPNIEARVPVEAEVRGAELALVAAGDRIAPSLQRLSQEERVADVAKYAEATEAGG